VLRAEDHVDAARRRIRHERDAPDARFGRRPVAGAREEDGIAHEGRDEAIGRAPVEVGGGVGLQNAAVVHHRDPIRDPEGLLLIVGHDDRRCAGRSENVLDLGADTGAQGGVEVGEGFVEQDDRRIGGEGPGDRDPLLLAARELVGAPSALGGEADQVEHLGDACLPVLPVSKSVRDVGRDRQVREERVVLEDDADPAPFGGNAACRIGDDDTLELDAPRIGLLETGDEAQGRRLAAPRGSEQGEELAGPHVEVDAPHGGVAAEALGEIPAGHDRVGVCGTVVLRTGHPATLREAKLPSPSSGRPTGVRPPTDGTPMADHHDATEEYLANILEVEEEGVKVMRARLVERLGVSATAVSETVGRLADQGFLELRDDRSVALTDKGRRLATSVVRRHRLAERLLTDVIGLEWEKVHREAGRWEHVISEDVEEKLVALLGDPATCPHGNPIPGSRREFRAQPTKALADCASGEVTVVRISEKLELSDEGLALVARARLMPGCRGTVTAPGPGGVTVSTATGEFEVPAEVAEHLYVAAG